MNMKPDIQAREPDASPKERVLSALTDIMQFDDDPLFVRLARQRFLNITGRIFVPERMAS